MPKPVIGRPSLEVKVMLAVWLDPTATDTLAAEGVATMVLSVPAPPALPVTLAEP